MELLWLVLLLMVLQLMERLMMVLQLMVPM
jgi:hypothetical protein